MATIEKTLESISAKLNTLLGSQKKETWVSATWITMLTGWGSNRMRQARNEKILKHRIRSSGGYEYLLESLPKEFIRNPAYRE